MKRLFFLVALISLAATPAFAQTRSVDLTGWVVWADPTGDNDFSDVEDAEDFETEFESEQGFGIAVNAFFTNTISVEFAASVMEPDLTLRSTDPELDEGTIGSLEMIPVTATLQFHFNPDGRLDPYIGGGVAYVLFDQVESDELRDIDIESIDFDDDYGFVANAGLSFDITPTFAVNLDAKYVPVSSPARAVIGGTESDEMEFDINPLILAAGLSMQF
ncbi:MAG: OmpW/AlkL family protein [Thermoanaerobaculia bacterium]